MASSNKEDAAAVERVRNRLASSPDGKLPHILSKLLPRLVARFIPNNAADAEAKPTENNLVVEEMAADPNLIGILEHVKERILLNPKLIESVWIDPLLQAVKIPQTEDGTSTTENAYLHLCYISQLHHTLPILELALPKITSDSNPLPQLLRMVEWFHETLPVLLTKVEKENQIVRTLNSRGNNAVQREQLDDDMMDTDDHNQVSGNEEARTETNRLVQLQQVWERVSWITIEQIAKGSNLGPVVDWNLLGSDWDEFNSSTTLKKLQDYAPTPEEEKEAGAGVFRLLLDAIIFDPKAREEVQAVRSNLAVARPNFAGVRNLVARADGHAAIRNNIVDARRQNGTDLSPGNVTSRWQFRRQTQSIQDDFDHAQLLREAQHAQGLLNRTHRTIRQDTSRRRDPVSWRDDELRYWYGVQQCLQSFSIKLFSRQPERENVLRIITGKIKPPSVLPLYNKMKPSEMKKINARKRSKVIQEQRKPVCSLTEEIVLLHMILGDHWSQSVRDTHDVKVWNYLEVLQGVSVASCALPCFMELKPLPQGISQRVFSHLVDSKLDLTSQYSENGTVNEAELSLFADLLYEIKSAPNLQTTISAQVYEHIGAKTPPPMCWPVHFLWTVVAEFSPKNMSYTAVPRALSRRGLEAATELLNQLQDVSLQRFEREQRLLRQRSSHDRLIHENREKLAKKDPFIFEALQARSDAYKMVAMLMTEEKVFTSADPNGEKKLSWDMAVQVLNCMAFDCNKDTASSLQATVRKVLSVYRQAIAKLQNSSSEDPNYLPINPLLLPILKVCISSSEWSREMAVEWAANIVYYMDPCIAQTVLTCLSNDEVSHISRKASEALRNLSFAIQKDVSKQAELTYFDLSQTSDKGVVLDDYRGRITALAERHAGVSDEVARRVLQEVHFSVEAAAKKLGEEETLIDVKKGGSDVDRSIAMDVDSSEATEATCGVCWDDIPRGKGFALKCGHIFCDSCWKEGIDAAAANPSWKELANLSCLHHNCDERLSREDVNSIAPLLVTALDEATLNWFIVSCSDYAFCPGPDCNLVAHHLGGPTQCKADCRVCTASFCFNCGDEPHSPASCDVKRRYTATSERVKAHEDAVENKTIPCPGCGMGITKNGGCNHMTCSQCGYEFCWICLSPNWQDHVCNVYDSLNGVDELQRFQFFRRRVEAHLDSAEVTDRLLKDFDRQGRELKSRCHLCQDSHLFILKEAWKMLVTGRNYLANSYIAAHGLTENVHEKVRQQFEEHQSQLQLFVEQLNFLSDSLRNLYGNGKEQDVQVYFRGLHFCTVAVAAYIQRIDSFTNENFDHGDNIDDKV